MTNIPVISVDSGIPVPDGYRGGLPLKDLKVGDSILFPLEHRSKVQIRASNLKKRHGLEFTIRKENDKTARIWRLK